MVYICGVNGHQGCIIIIIIIIKTRLCADTDTNVASMHALVLEEGRMGWGGEGG